MTGRGSLILCYHRVQESVEDPFQLCVTPENFAAHLEELARYCEPSTLDQLTVPSRRPRVVVTFDDGYVDNLTNVAPIAEAKGIPVTVFVTSGMLGNSRGFWWDRLGTLLRSRPSEMREVRVPAAGGTVRVAVGSPKLSVDLQSVRRHLLPLPVAEIHDTLDTVAESWGVSASSPPDARSLTRSEFAELAGSEVVTIGAHTVDHVRLRGLPAPVQETTISTSKQELERLMGQDVAHFAYPFGGADSYDEHTVDAVRTAGFKTASTTIAANPRPTSDPHLLPRRLVMDWGRHRFRGQLARWRLVTQR